MPMKYNIQPQRAMLLLMLSFIYRFAYAALHAAVLCGVVFVIVRRADLHKGCIGPYLNPITAVSNRYL